MKLSKKVFTLAVTCCIMLSSTLTMASVNPLNETFTVENMDNVIARVGYATYMITKDNKVVVTGNVTHGLGVQNSYITQKNWEYVIDNETYLPIENVVKLRAVQGALYLINSEGKLYCLGSAALVDYNKVGNYTMAYKSPIFNPYEYSDIVGYYSHEGTTAPNRINHFMRASKDSYTSWYGGQYSYYFKEKGKKIFTTRTNTFMIGENGRLYISDSRTFNQVKDYNGTPVMNIVDACVPKIGATDLGYLLTTGGDVLALSNGVVTSKLEIYNLSMDKVTDKIIDIMASNSTNDNSNTTIWSGYARSREHTYQIQNNKLVEVDLPFTPVAVLSGTYDDANRLFLSKDGKLYAYGNNGSNWMGGNQSTYESYTEFDYDWLVDFVFDGEDYYSFDIENNATVSNKEPMSFKFSMATPDKTPSSFDIYYVPSETVGDNSKWISIEKGVSSSSLKPQESLDKNGTKTTTYEYTWTHTGENLVNIKLVVVPVYE